MIYRNYMIDHRPPPIPDRSSDWSFAHVDYDGPPDPRHGYGPDVEACRSEIDDQITGEVDL